MSVWTEPGRLDVRRTVRRALSTGGVPVDPRFRRPRPGRPEIVVLADVSCSVATFARFTMQVVFALSAPFRRVRSFAFIDAIDEVTDFFGPGADFTEAMRRIGTEAGVVWLDGHSDYDNSFKSFTERYAEAVTSKTTVIVTGDARSNYHEPNVAALRDIAAPARAVYWLNPEAAPPKRSKVRPFAEARAYARRLGLESSTQWRRFCKHEMPEKGILPDDVPRAPQVTYGRGGPWVSWTDWLGTKRKSTSR